jgi:dTDP-4-amino-4,6-dideoxygalactose transaminase
MMLTDSGSIPLLDLAASHDEVRRELDAAWKLVTTTNAFVGGDLVERFESEFAAYCGATHCVGVGSGTDALELILAALGIGPGDEVIVPANTFVATAAAIVTVGATPVFVDVDADTLLVALDAVEAAITPATAALTVVHLYGQTPDMTALRRLAERHGLALLEDAAQAHGAAWEGRRAGALAHAAAFSFYPAKNLGAFGEAGAVVTDDTDLAARVRSGANHGRAPSSHHIHPMRGRNSRLDALQAAILSVKLPRLDDWNARRRWAAVRYRTLLDGTACRPVRVHPLATPVYHLEVVRVRARDRLLRELTSRGIGWGLHYPIPCHRQEAFARYASGALPVAEQAAREVVSLPMFPTISESQIARVCEGVRIAMEGNVDAA